jgi:ABC-type uncharacterized transport system permease subunit
LAIAKALLERGATVLLCARKIADVEKTVAELIEQFGNKVIATACDVSVYQQVQDVFGLAESQIGGMSFADLMNYTLASVLFSQIRGGNHDFELAEMIRSGQLSQYLLRPINCIEFVYVRGVAPKIFLAALCLCIGLIVSIWTEISPLRMIGAMGLALIGNVIHYLIGAALAAAAFYWEEAYSILMVKNMIVGILCGDLIPLSLFPPSMTWLWKYTPFYLYVYGPAQYALGKWSHQEFLHHCSSEPGGSAHLF